MGFVHNDTPTRTLELNCRELIARSMISTLVAIVFLTVMDYVISIILVASSSQTV